MSINADGLFQLLVDVSIKAALLAGIAGLLLFALRVRNANLQHRVWLAVLVAMLALPLLVYVVPRVPLPIAKHAAATVVNVDKRQPTPIEAMPVQHSAKSVVTADQFVDPISTPAATPSLGDEGGRTAGESMPRSAVDWPVRLPELLLAGYLLGVVWFGLRLFIGIWRARQLVRLSHSIEPAPNQQQVIGAARVRESALVRVPLTVGWSHPTIVLPSDWQTWDKSMLSAVLSHEQEHVRRCDPWIAILAELNRAIYWFHPVAWFLRRRLSTLAEAACDDAVIASSGDRSGYARHLLAIASRLSGKSRRLAPAGVAMARTPQVERRINAVLDSTRPFARRLSITTTLAIMLISASLAVLTAGLQASDQKPGEAAPAPAATSTPEPTATPSAAPAAQLPAFKAGSSAPNPAPQTTAEASLLSAGPIRELKATGGGHNFEFAVNVPKGRQFGVSFGEWPVRIAAPIYSPREKESNGPITASLRLEYSSNSKGKQRDDVLLSNDEWMEFRLKTPGCYPQEIVHVAGVPLNNVPTAEKKVILIPPDSPLAKAKSGIRLMLVVRKDQDPKTAAEIEKIEPRGELVVSLVPVEKPKPEPTPQELLADAWGRAESGIGTFFVRYQYLTGSPSWFKPLPVETVRKIISDAAAKHLKRDYGSSDTDAWQSHRFVTEVLRATLSDEQLERLDGSPIKLAQCDFRMVGSKTLNIDGTGAGQIPWMYRLFDGDLDLEYDPVNRQLTVMKAGQSRVALTRLDNFRTLVGTLNFRFTNADKALTKSSMKLLPNGRALMSFGSAEVVANPQNGFVERFADGRGPEAEDEILQFGPKEFPGKQTFPRSKLDIQYRDGKLSSITVFTSDELRVNEGFNDSDFTLKLPANVTVVDYRVSESRPDSFKVDAEIPDAAAFAKTHLGRKPLAKSPKK